MKYGEVKGGWCTRTCGGLMVVGYGGVLAKGGTLLLSISLLWWGMVLAFFFGMISRLGKILLNSLSSVICVSSQ